MFKLAQDRNTDEVLVDMLCIAYAKELKAYHGYLHAYVTVTGPMESVYGEVYESFMQREMHHLEELGKKIVAMGGMPPIEYPTMKPIADAIYKGYDETLAALQDAEVETLEMYKKIHAAADKAGDLPLVLLIEEIMQEEEEHHDELQRILMDVPGKNNVEMHDELVVDAFEVRKNKLADLLTDVSEDVSNFWEEPENDNIPKKNVEYMEGIEQVDDVYRSKRDQVSELNDLLWELENESAEHGFCDHGVAEYITLFKQYSRALNELAAILKKNKYNEHVKEQFKIFKEHQKAFQETIDEIKEQQNTNNASDNKYATIVTDNINKREKKFAELMDLPAVKNEVDMNRYAGRWMKINKEIVKLLNDMGINEDDVGIIDYNDEAYPELLRNLMRQRDAIQERLSGYDSSWLIGYMEDESKEEKPLPQDEGKQEKQYEGVKVRKKKLADLFIEAGIFDGYTAKQLHDEKVKLMAEVRRLFELAPSKDGVSSIDDNVPELKKQYLEVENKLNAVLDEMEKRELVPPRRVNIWKDDKKFKATDEDAPPTITDNNIDAYIKKWVKLNNEINDMEDEEYGEDHPDMRKLMRERKNIERALDDFDDNWMRDYFGDEEPMDEVESVETMRNYR